MAQEDKERLPGDRVTGKVIAWRASFGWIKPEEPVEHEKAEMHGGKLFVHRNDLEEGIKRLKRGSTVDFFVYADSTGLGAEECRILEEPEKEEKREKGEKGEKGGKGAGKAGKSIKPLSKQKRAQAASGVIRTIGKRKGEAANVAAGVVKGARKWLGLAGGRQPIAAKGKGGAKGKGKGKDKGKDKGIAKGSSKGKGKDKGASKGAGKGKGIDSYQDSRGRVSSKRVSGTVKKWMGKFGWITPDTHVEHEGAEHHGGDIFVHANDVGEGRLHRGATVDFIVYADEGGLGAEKIRIKGGSGKGKGHEGPGSAGKGAAAGSGKGSSKGKSKGASAPEKGKGAGKEGKGQGKNGSSGPQRGSSFAASSIKPVSKSAGKGGAARPSPGAGAPAKGEGKSAAGGKASGGKAAGGKAAGGKATGKGSAIAAKGGAGVQRTITKGNTSTSKGKGKGEVGGAQRKKGKGGGKSQKAADGALPASWEEHWSEEHDLPYYWHPKTKESRWVKPE